MWERCIHLSGFITGWEIQKYRTSWNEKFCTCLCQVKVVFAGVCVFCLHIANMLWNEFPGAYILIVNEKKQKNFSSNKHVRSFKAKVVYNVVCEIKTE